MPPRPISPRETETVELLVWRLRQRLLLLPWLEVLQGPTIKGVPRGLHLLPRAARAARLATRRGLREVPATTAVTKGPPASRQLARRTVEIDVRDGV